MNTGKMFAMSDDTVNVTVYWFKSLLKCFISAIYPCHIKFHSDGYNCISFHIKGYTESNVPFQWILKCS